jgi:hypothetical protein
MSGPVEKLNEGVNGPPFVDFGGSHSYIFVYIRDFCKREFAISY